MCVGIYIYTCINKRHHEWIQIHCVRIGIHAYVSVFVRVCGCIHMYTYMYERQRDCIRICVCVCIYLHIFMLTSQVGVLNVCMCVYTYLQIWSPSLLVCV